MLSEKSPPHWRCIGGPLNGKLAYNTSEQFVHKVGNHFHVYAVDFDGLEQVFRYTNTATMPDSADESS